MMLLSPQRETSYSPLTESLLAVTSIPLKACSDRVASESCLLTDDRHPELAEIRES